MRPAPYGYLTGVGDAGIAFRNELPAIDLAAQASLAALTDAGLSTADIDGVATSKTSDLLPSDKPSSDLADHLGIRARWVDTTLVGGASPVVQVGHAIDAIAAGRCRRVLVVYSSTQASSRQRHVGGHARPADAEPARTERASGLPFPIGVNALAAAQYLHRYGGTPEQLAAVAVAARAWAQLNPQALRREPLTVADALAAPLIAAPLRRTDCCLVTDGAGAVVVEGDARDGRAIAVRGFAEFHQHSSILSAEDLLATSALRTGPAAFEQAGAGPADVGLLQIYDAFTILPIVLMENLGLAGEGQAGALVAEGRTGPGGDLAMNTQGGGLSHCHPGSYGVFLMIEAVRQLRGEAVGRQVPDPRLTLVQGAGGGAFGGSQATLLLERS